MRHAIYNGIVKAPIVGLLNLPEVTGGECAPGERAATVRVYTGPSRSRPIVGTLDVRDCALVLRRTGSDSVEELPAAESGYEYTAAIVRQRTGRWFRIALQKGSGWVESRDPVNFHPYPELLSHRLAYLQSNWDGRLWKTPAGTAISTAPTAWKPFLKDNLPIKLLGSRRIGSRTWMQVRVDFAVNQCDDTRPHLAPLTGWIPAFRASGEPAAWFYSRGC